MSIIRANNINDINADSNVHKSFERSPIVVLNGPGQRFEVPPHVIKLSTHLPISFSRSIYWSNQEALLLDQSLGQLAREA